MHTMPPPQSVDMVRRDSGNPIEDRKIFQSVAASAQFTPSSKQNVGMNPFGPVFTPGKGFSAAEGFSAAQNYSASKGHSTSTSSTFRTPVKGSAMKFLNLGSTPEEPSTKASSASPVKPIGSGFSSPSRQASFRDGPPFSTDADPNVAETRFVRFGMIPLEWFKDDTLKEVLHGTGLVGLIDNCVAAVGDTPHHLSLYARFDDLRSASASKDMFESALTTVTFEFISHHEYFGIDFSHPRAQTVSAYDGQVEFIATPKSMMDFNIQTIYAEVRDLAAAFGPVRSFAFTETRGFQAPRFRAEYFSVKSADDAVAMSVDTNAAYHSETVTVSIKTYEPAGYKPYVHPAAHGMSDLVAATEDLAVFDESDDGYNHYTTRRHRDEYTPRSRGDCTPRRFRGGNRAHPSRGIEPNWWALSKDSPVHQMDMEFWRWNQPQTVNLQKIEAGIDVRTTIMLRNIPNRVDFEDLKLFLDATSEGHYDFSYLRIDFSNNLNVGYAFVNFVRPEFITNFVQRRVGQEWNMYGSLKKCEVSYATIQGIDCLLAKFRNSVVMEEIPRYRPKLWYHIDSTDLPTIGGAPDLDAIGTEAEFPAPNNEQKRRRSRDNAGTIGLYPPRRGRGPDGPGSYYREGQYDRGNSFAIAEENQIEQQRQLNFNERRTIGFRGNDRRQHGPSRDRVYHQQLRYRNGGYNHHNTEEEYDHFDQNNVHFRGNNRHSGYYRR